MLNQIKAFGRILRREVMLLAWILFAGGLFVVAGVILLSADTHSGDLSQVLSQFGVNVMVSGYPLLLFIRVVLWLIRRK